MVGSSNSLLIEWLGAVVDGADCLLVDFYDGRVLGGDAAVTPAVQAQASINRSVSQRDESCSLVVEDSRILTAIGK